MKRSAQESNKTSNSAKKTCRIEKGKDKQTQEQIQWPEHFSSLFTVFKAVNTVLAFVSSRKQLATTFDAIRSSVENILKRPLELSAIAEIKALLPDLVKFSYLPKYQLKINDTGPTPKRPGSPDFFIHKGKGTSPNEGDDDEGHVLVLELADNLKGKKSKNAGYNRPPSLSPTAVKKLVDSRNEIFIQAVNDLILAMEDKGDPVHLLQEAAREHIPVNPRLKSSDQDRIIPEVDSRPSVDRVLHGLMAQEWYKEQIVFRKTMEAHEPHFEKPGFELSSSITQAFASARQIKSFYVHQACAIEALFTGKHVVVSTSTASGKSLIYQTPILKFLEENPNARIVCIYPTKALAQDQKAALQQLIQNCPGLEKLQVATYDGDTPTDIRPVVRDTASVIFTNFDTIHASILPHEENWRHFLSSIKLVVVDELHYYSGLMGSHVAFIMRRFRWVCAAVGNREMLFISCTATLANPRAHMKMIFSLEESEVEVIDTDGSPCGRKDFLVWNPPMINPEDPRSGRRSSISEATRLMHFLMKKGFRVLLFCKIRKVCELAMKAIKTDLSNEGRLDILEKVKPYRGGYSQEDRRHIEKEAFSGNLLGIVSTNALELGIDIGALDAVIMLGFPMSVASFRQQAGRAGRRARDSLAILVTDPVPVDQYYVKHASELFDQAMEDVVVDICNPITLEAHLQCASYEMPINEEDEIYFGPLMHDICKTKLTQDKDGWYHTHPNFLPYPAVHVSIRGIQEEKYAVVLVKSDNTPKSVLEEVEVSRALFEIYEGGVFMHQGMTFIVKEVSHDDKTAKVVQANVNYHTTPRDFTNIDAIRTTRIRAINNHRAFFGMVKVEVKVFGFFKVSNNSILDSLEIDTPSYIINTTGLWVDVPRPILDLLRSKRFNLAEAIHSAQHAFLNQFPLSEDLKTECKAAEKEYKVTESRRKRPARLIFYDAVGKGGGVAAKAFDYAFETLNKAHHAIENCACQNGCTDCVQGYTCREANEVSSKLGGGIIIKGILGVHIDPATIPFQAVRQDLPDTIIEAEIVHARENITLEGERLH